VPRFVDVAYIIVDEDAMPSSVRGGHHLDPLRAGQLALGEHPADLIVEDLRGGTGDGAQPGRLELGQPLLDRHAGLGRGGHDLHRGERVHVHAGHGGVHRADQVGVERDRQLRVDTALHADLGGPVGGRLGGAGGDLVEDSRNASASRSRWANAQNRQPT